MALGLKKFWGTALQYLFFIHYDVQIWHFLFYYYIMKNLSSLMMLNDE